LLSFERLESQLLHAIDSTLCIRDFVGDHVDAPTI
jgi:hypothetical protein